jgi:rubrerythrin
MVDFRMTLKAQAGDFAFAEEHRAAELRRQLARIDEERAKVAAGLDQVAKASARIRTYIPKVGDTYQCPVCWIKKGEQVPLTPQGSSTHDDEYRCRVCHHPATHER